MDDEEAKLEEPSAPAVEFSSEDDGTLTRDELETFRQAVLWGNDWTVETVISQLRKGNIELNPRFQRRDAWSKVAKSRFIESVILGLPIPQVVLAERADERGRYIVLDGKQRLLSLLQFSGNATGPSNSFSLSGLEARPDLARKRYHHLETVPALTKDLLAFNSHTIRAVLIRNWPSMRFLHLVFQRLNSGSLKLSAQELRQAVAPGPFTDAADDFSQNSAPLHKLLGRKSPDPRMRDVELLVRFIGFQFFLEQYRGRIREFLDEVCAELNESWAGKGAAVLAAFEQFEMGVSALENIFGERGIARKKDSMLFNRAIFDPLIFFAADKGTREVMLAHADEVRAAYATVVDDEKFQIASESDTAGIPHTHARLSIWRDALVAATGAKLPNVSQRNNRILLAPAQ